jgi:hypothetical protein
MTDAPSILTLTVNPNMNATLDVVIDDETQLRTALVDSRGMLSFQKLRVYQRSIEFLALVLDVINALPKGHA